MSRCFSKSTAWTWNLRQAESRNLSNNQPCVNLGWCWSISVHFPTVWFLPVTVYLDTIHFQLWLKRMGERARIGVLYNSYPFCICHPVSTHLGYLCLFVSEPKQEVSRRQLHRRKKTLFWTTHGLTYFRNTFQNSLELQESTWLLHTETWICAGHSATVTAISA